jgi:hypothetical protein
VQPMIVDGNNRVSQPVSFWGSQPSDPTFQSAVTAVWTANGGGLVSFQGRMNAAATLTAADVSGAGGVTNNQTGLTLDGTFSGNGSGVVGVPADSPTNSWTADTPLPVGTGTNYVFASGTVTAGIPGVLNVPTSTERCGQLMIIATGTVTLTNSPAIHMSDGLTSRTVTNGTVAMVSVDVMPGQPHGTNGAIVHFP